MSLDFDVSKIDGHESLWTADGKDLLPVTKALVFATMSVGLYEITEANALQFWTRLSMVERVFGPYLHLHDPEVGDTVPRPLTAEDVHAHIGLRTNAFPNVTDAAWSTRLLKSYADDRRREWEREQQTATV